MAAIGREYLVEPHWIEKVQAGREADIRYEVDPNDAEELGLSPPLLNFLTSGIPFPLKSRQQENGNDAIFSKWNILKTSNAVFIFSINNYINKKALLVHQLVNQPQ